MEPIINVKLGGAPVTQRVIETAKEAYMSAKGWTAAMRDDAMAEDSFARRGWMTETPNYDRILPALASFENALIWTMQINVFNALLQEYKIAEQRLTRYILSEGRPEITEEVETGKFNPDGSSHIETVVVSEEVPPLPPTVDVSEFDEDGTERIVVVPNPEIERDELERAIAQRVLDEIPPQIHAIPCIYPEEPNKLTDFFIATI